MSWYDTFVDKLFKRKIEESSASALFSRIDVNQFFNQLNNLWSPSELIHKVGGYQKLSILYKDQDIYAAIDKRIAALLDTKLVIEGENQEYVDFFTSQLKPFERQLKQDFWWTIYNGWGVEQIIYKEDGSGKIAGFQREDFWRFEPMRDLIHVKCVNTDNTEIRDQLMPYGKWVLTTNNGSASNPWGDAMAERLIMPWIFKCNGWDLWMDFAKRFSNGYMHARIEDAENAANFRAVLEKSAKSSVIVTDKSSEITLTQPNRDSSLYQAIHDKAVATMNKVVLGETQTSDIGTNGGYASASIHNDVRLEKTRADIDLVTTAINEIIRQVAQVNGFDLTNLPVATLIYDPAFNMELAARDNTLHGMGVRFTKKYYMDNYGFSEEDFDIAEETAQPSNSWFSKPRNKSAFLSPQDMKNYIGGLEPKCTHHKFDAETSRKATRQDNEREEIVQLLARNSEPPISTEDLIAAIMTSENQSQLDEKLSLLFDVRNNKFAEDMAKGLYLSAARGAMFGNPETLSNEEE